MVPKKGFRYLIEALPRIDRLLGRTAPCTLLLVGEGPLREELQRLAERLGVRERVIFAGKVAYRQLPQWYWLADILAMPAVREPADGLNVVVVEAMKYALPVAATDVGGNELVVRDGENGRLCPERDPDGLARCLAELIEDPERRTRMGAAGRRIFRQIASWDRIVEQYERLFRTAARRR
ncbi:MAG: glycosyltransferase family 1 protein [Zetaproteobacteria bacterium]|nr:MAG: glycosyltransferase family 1 protein [Zetaproteobacteria bacterium]